jgi:hypothetical protein
MKTITQPKNTVRQYVINDPHNPLKLHIFRIYRCGHTTYNQAINGRLFYRRFVPANKHHGYRGHLATVLRQDAPVSTTWLETERSCK